MNSRRHGVAFHILQTKLVLADCSPRVRGAILFDMCVVSWPHSHAEYYDTDCGTKKSLARSLQGPPFALNMVPCSWHEMRKVLVAKAVT